MSVDVEAFYTYENLHTQLTEAIDEASQECAFDHNASLQEICLEYFEMPIEKLADILIQEIFDDYDYKINKNFILKYCAQIAKLEIEAYAKQAEFLKAYNLIDEAKQAEMKLEINKAIVQSANSLI